MSFASVLKLDPGAYKPHALHGEERAWVEKNCYIDVWIELVHALGLDPTAMLPFTFRLDFEGDQWTFFKPPHSDLLGLYGIDVQEMSVWKPLAQHAAYHAGQGKFLLAEADAFFMPDTKGTDYRTQHTKTTIAIESIDVEARKLRYFHNAGYYALEGDDFAGLFRLDVPHDSQHMPFFVELVRVDRVKRLPAKELVAASIARLREHLAYRPTTNPFTRFKEQFVNDVPWLKEHGMAQYHAYAFVSIRQCGAAFELGSQYLTWLEAHGETGLTEAASQCEAIGASAKALILKTARAVMSKRTVDFTEMFDGMETSYAAMMATLVAKYGDAPAT